jgi:hypothetical protein
MTFYSLGNFIFISPPFRSCASMLIFHVTWRNLCQQETALCLKRRTTKCINIGAAQKTKHSRSTQITLVATLLIFCPSLFFNFRMAGVAVLADVSLHSHMSAHFLTFALTFTHQLSRSVNKSINQFNQLHFSNE